MSRNARMGILAAFIATAVVAFVVLKPGDDKKTSSATTATTPVASTTPGAPTKTTPAKPVIPVVQVKGGKPVGGIQKLSFPHGGTILFKVMSDAAGEIHFHGYDIHKDVTKGGSVTFDVPAKVDGAFVVEVEDSGEQIAEIKVEP